MLGSGLLMFIYSGISLFSMPEFFVEPAVSSSADATGGMLLAKSAPEAIVLAEPASNMVNETARQAISVQPFDFNSFFIQFLLIAGFVIFCYGLYSLIKRKD
jgi:hypothetical protein